MGKKIKNGCCKKMEIECVTCQARGIIPTEESEKWLVCPNCQGSGSKNVEMILFTGRILADGVEVVSRDGEGAKSVTYGEFLTGARP